ncbi:unnamed protein product [Mytilus edulis]|uniref:Endonuclease/exonuclease/phosphatase domain-containing protein n=1 Tax=Mytilus edulis TaxID=6550 RepID=A0A8S3Q3Y0_MYTED|nr:unnamed protein product [Mytilus edulis]
MSNSQELGESTRCPNETVVTAEIHDDEIETSNVSTSINDSCNNSNIRKRPASGNSDISDNKRSRNQTPVSKDEKSKPKPKPKAKSEMKELKDMMLGLTDSMNNMCISLTQRIDSLEKNMSIEITQLIEEKVKVEIDQVRQDFNDQFNNFKDQIKGLEAKVSTQVKSYSDVVKQNNCNVIIRNLQEDPREESNTSILEKTVISLVRDGLNLKDVFIESVSRKKSHNSKPGVIVAAVNNSDQKRELMKAKRNLKNVHKFKDVYIENDMSYSERRNEANFRTLIRAFKQENQAFTMNGGRIVKVHHNNQSSVASGKSGEGKQNESVNGRNVHQNEGNNGQRQGYSNRGNIRGGGRGRGRELHILGIAETHLVKNNTISVDGYTWFGHNRIGIHIRAKAGSGGVGFLVRNDLMELFNVIVVEDSIDGICWLKFEDKLNLDNIFYACVVYLPPENSTRAVNVHEFLESLMSQMYTIPKGNQFYLCGDFNSRCGDLNDFVEGIDTLPERQVVDYKTNKYGSIFCEFLADINCCMLNGRNNSHNDYTYVSTRGLSVVDYCIVPYEMLKSFDRFEDVDIIGIVDPTRCMPDHSLLSWSMHLNFPVDENTEPKANAASFKTKYDLGKIPDDWLNSESFISDIDRIICILEESEANQCDIDKTYESFINSIKSEMSEKIPNKIIQISNGSSNKHRRIKKPWWSTELTDLWNEVCKSETMYLKTKSCHSKKQLRHLYCQNRKLFDKNVQQAKRRYWYKMQDDLTSSCDNPKEFWRKIGKIGIGAERQRNIPMEINLEDGSVSTDQFQF